MKRTFVMKYVSSEAFADRMTTKANADNHPTHALSMFKMAQIIFTGLHIEKGVTSWGKHEQK